MTEKTKKWLKIAGIAVLVLIVYGLFNMKTSPIRSPKGDSLPGMMLESPAVMEKSGRMLSKSTTTDSMALQETENFSASDEGLSGSKGQEITQVEKKIIKNGNLSLRVEKTEQAVKKIAQVAKGFGGEVFSSSFSERTKGSKNGYMTIKVPSDKFDQTMEEIKEVATQVVNESSNAQDVTEQYVDLQAQLKNKKAEEGAFLKILDRSGEIKDVLSVTREVSRVRGEIERLQARINYMESQTSKATISVSLSQDATITPINDDWRPWQIVKGSVKQLTKNFQNFVDGLIEFIIVGLPGLIIIFFIVWLIIWIGKKIFRKIFRKSPPVTGGQ
jgi:hypothetical protein